MQTTGHTAGRIARAQTRAIADDPSPARSVAAGRRGLDVDAYVAAEGDPVAQPGLGPSHALDAASPKAGQAGAKPVVATTSESGSPWASSQIAWSCRAAQASSPARYRRPHSATLR